MVANFLCASQASFRVKKSGETLRRFFSFLRRAITL